MEWASMQAKGQLPRATDVSDVDALEKLARVATDEPVKLQEKDLVCASAFLAAYVHG